SVIVRRRRQLFATAMPPRRDWPPASAPIGRCPTRATGKHSDHRQAARAPARHQGVLRPCPGRRAGVALPLPAGSPRVAAAGSVPRRLHAGARSLSPVPIPPRRNCPPASEAAVLVHRASRDRPLALRWSGHTLIQAVATFAIGVRPHRAERDPLPSAG